MISTPELAVNPRSLNQMDSLSKGDAIPVEQASGFGGYIERTALHDSIVQGYAELTATTTVDVAERFGDLYLRVTATTNPTITISGNLQAGRKLTLDVRSATNGCTFVIGDITYTLAAVDGVCVFHCTTDGWARPSGFFYRIKCFFDLIVTGLASISGALTVGGNASIGGALGVTGGATIGGGASIGGNASVGGTLDVTDIARLGKLYVSGDTTLNALRALLGARVLSLTVDGDASVGNDLLVTRDASVQRNLGVLGGLTVGGPVALANVTASFSGEATFNSYINPTTNPYGFATNVGAGESLTIPRGAFIVADHKTNNGEWCLEFYVSSLVGWVKASSGGENGDRRMHFIFSSGAGWRIRNNASYGITFHYWKF